MEYIIAQNRNRDLPYLVTDTNGIIFYKAETEDDAIDWINERSTLEINENGLTEKQK